MIWNSLGFLRGGAKRERDLEKGREGEWREARRD